MKAILKIVSIFRVVCPGEKYKCAIFTLSNLFFGKPVMIVQHAFNVLNILH